MERPAESRAAALTYLRLVYCLSPLRAKSFPQKDVWSPWAICIRHYTDEVKAESTIKWQRMASPAAHGAERVRKRRVQVALAERCLSGEVVAAGPQRQSATGNQKGLEIEDQCSPTRGDGVSRNAIG